MTVIKRRKMCSKDCQVMKIRTRIYKNHADRHNVGGYNTNKNRKMYLSNPRIFNSSPSHNIPKSLE
jgi:hypothetical protein